jgi:GDP-4-dehydro-6-deoxy-D-mannose reductase
MKKILITGFSGFVAYHFLNYLNSISFNTQIDILGLDLHKPKDYDLWHFENLNIKIIECQLINRDAVIKIVKDFNPTHILHLAALSSVGLSWQDPAGCFENNTTIFLNLAEAVREYIPECRMLCIGSSEEYGTVTLDDLPLKETKCIHPSNPYAITKMVQEEMGKCYVDKFKMNIIFTRSFNHIGPRQRDTFVIASFAKQVALAMIENKSEISITAGNIAVKRDFLDVRDVVKAYYSLLTNGKSGEVYNVCSGNSYSLSSIIENLTSLSGVKIKTVINKDLLRPNDIVEIRGDNTKITTDTGWRVEYTITRSISDVLEYWKSEYLK